MRQIEKSHKLDNVCYDVRGPVVRESALMEAQGKKILKLNIGNPAPFGFKAPEYLLAAIEKSLSLADGYSDSKGIPEARRAIVSWCEKKGISGVTPDDVYTGNGVSELIVMLMQGLLNTGDEILLPSPDYPLWTAAATLAGGKAAHYVCDEGSGWIPDLEDMKSRITPNTKGIVVINPNNPTGALYPKEILEGIADIAREHSLVLFADEIYDRLVFDGGKHIALASLAPDCLCVTMGGLSKSHRSAGFRIGWMCISGDKSNASGYIEGINMLSSMRLCSNVPAQYAIAPALRDESPDLDMLPGGRIYERRETITAAINAIPGVSAVKPKAAFYIFPKIDIKRYNILDDEQFALDFLREKNILVVHGKGFNYMRPDHFRIVFLPEQELLKKAAGELADFLQKLGR
jgi:alanine-synthesizing transaminase